MKSLQKLKFKQSLKTFYGLVKWPGFNFQKTINQRPLSSPYAKQDEPIPKENISIPEITDEVLQVKGKDLAQVLDKFGKDIGYCSYNMAHHVQFDNAVIDVERHKVEII